MSRKNEAPSEADMFAKPEKLYPCKVCGRKFKQDAHQKHEKICKKVTNTKRKVFDTGKQRAGPGSDITYDQVKRAQKEISKGPRLPKTHWREKHEEFVGAVRAARQVDNALKTGSPLPPPPKATVPSDYVKCPHCERNFNASAAERHIPFCAAKVKATTGPPRGPPRGGPMKPAPSSKVSYPKPGERQSRPGANAKSTIPKPQPRKQSQPRGRSPGSLNRSMNKMSVNGKKK